MTRNPQLQGDRVSPFLFGIAYNVLSGLLERFLVGSRKVCVSHIEQLTRTLGPLSGYDCIGRKNLPPNNWVGFDPGTQTNPQALLFQRKSQETLC